jgi:hypothetical protein
MTKEEVIETCDLFMQRYQAEPARLSCAAIMHPRPQSAQRSLGNNQAKQMKMID